MNESSVLEDSASSQNHCEYSESIDDAAVINDGLRMPNTFEEDDASILNENELQAFLQTSSNDQKKSTSVPKELLVMYRNLHGHTWQPPNINSQTNYARNLLWKVPTHSKNITLPLIDHQQNVLNYKDRDMSLSHSQHEISLHSNVKKSYSTIKRVSTLIHDTILEVNHEPLFIRTNTL